MIFLSMFLENIWDIDSLKNISASDLSKDSKSVLKFLMEKSS